MDRLLRLIPRRIGSQPMTPVKRFRPNSRLENRNYLKSRKMSAVINRWARTLPIRDLASSGALAVK